MKQYCFHTNIWYDYEDICLDFPEKWNVEVCHMDGYERPVLTDDQVKEKISKPIGRRSISEDAKGCKSAVILFDDLTRPTQTYRIVPHVLEELKAAGVPDSKISFIMAQGLHRAHTRFDFEKKLGKAILDRYPVFNHNPFNNCVRIGRTSFGVPVELNEEFMAADFKLGIGGIVPHPQMGFGGGGKLIVPGVASLETIRKNHYLSRSSKGDFQEDAGFGTYEDNNHRKDVDEIARMCGFNFKIDAFFNYKGDIVDIIAGDPVDSFREGVTKAKTHYRTQSASNMDLVIANGYCKANEPGIVMLNNPMRSLKENGGDLVVIFNIAEGGAPHYLYGRWGSIPIGGWDWKEATSLPPKVNRLFILSNYIDRGSDWWFGPSDKLNWIQEWPKLVELLGTGDKRVALYPDATIQMIV